MFKYKFQTESSLQCPLKGWRKTFTPKNALPETNIAPKIDGWKMKFPGVFSCQTFRLLRMNRFCAGYFLDSVCDQIFEIDWNGETFAHPRGWETFLKRRAERAWKYKSSDGFWKGMRFGRMKTGER